ncbi:MAG: hypothetical protein AAF961_02385 [Planctomycetota bacterium]
MISASHSAGVRDPISILPGGDRLDLPPGRRQFRLISLLWLLTLGALIATICRLLTLQVDWLVTSEALLFVVWWRIAERRVEPSPRDTIDQTELRAEVRRWLKRRDERQ